MPTPDEPRAVWRSVTDDELTALVTGLIGGAPLALVLLDGRSGAGKSTWAGVLARLLDASVVHTDDLAWHHSVTDWDDLLLDHVVEPWRRGEPVVYRPPGWVVRDRPGAVQVPPSRVLVVEGVGAARASLTSSAQLVAWVQSDREVARRLGLLRDVGQGRTPAQAAAFWAEWALVEDPFQERSQPWTRADLVLAGTLGPAVPRPPEGRRLVAPGPLVSVSSRTGGA